MKKAQRPVSSDEDHEDAELAVATAGHEADMAQPKADIVVSEVEQDGDDAPDAAKEETKGQMAQRHKREAKAAKDQIKRLGKKGKEEGAKLLRDMEERHAREMKALEEREKGAPDSLADGLSNLTFYAGGEGKKTKAQMRREKLEQEEVEREKRIAEELEAMGETDREVEEQALLERLAATGLRMKDIPSDGHCLYKAIEDQIRSLPDGGSSVMDRAGGKDPSYTRLRQICAEYLLGHQEEFIDFVEVEDVEGFKAYCNEIESTAAWGGHVELQALSRALSLHVKVYSSDGDPIDVGPEHDQTVHVCYLRHSCALGEHYNSCLVL